MNFKTLLASIFLSTTAFAQGTPTSTPCETQPEKVTQDFGYVGLGLGPMPALLPNFSIGYRLQSGHHGGDFSAQVATIVAVTQVKTNFLYHYYFKPSLSSQFYAGGGVSPSVVFHGSHVGGTIASELVFGKQYRNKSDDLRFFQAQIDFPTVQFGLKPMDRVILFPLVTFTYGIGF